MISDPLRNDALVAVGMVQVVKGIVEDVPTSEMLRKQLPPFDSVEFLVRLALIISAGRPAYFSLPIHFCDFHVDVLARASESNNLMKLCSFAQ